MSGELVTLDANLDHEIRVHRFFLNLTSDKNRKYIYFLFGFSSYDRYSFFVSYSTGSKNDSVNSDLYKHPQEIINYSTGFLYESQFQQLLEDYYYKPCYSNIVPIIFSCNSSNTNYLDIQSEVLKECITLGRYKSNNCFIIEEDFTFSFNRLKPKAFFLKTVNLIIYIKELSISFSTDSNLYFKNKIYEVTIKFVSKSPTHNTTSFQTELCLNSIISQFLWSKKRNVCYTVIDFFNLRSLINSLRSSLFTFECILERNGKLIESSNTKSEWLSSGEVLKSLGVGTLTSICDL